MAAERLEAGYAIVGDQPFGLVDKDVKFARWDARKSLRWQESHELKRRLELYESTPNDDLLDRMQQLHANVLEMEQNGLESNAILRVVLTETPNLNEYGLLLRKTTWGEKLIDALRSETYNQDESGALWDDFVVGRIQRVLGGDLKKYERYDGRFSYQLDAPNDVLRFDPESNARKNDGPEFHIRGNGKPRDGHGWDTDQRFSIDINNVSKVSLNETAGKVKVFKDLGEEYLRLTYQRIAVGSTHQLEIDLVSK